MDNIGLQTNCGDLLKNLSFGIMKVFDLIQKERRREKRGFSAQNVFLGQLK